MNRNLRLKLAISIGALFWLILGLVIWWGATDDPKLNFSTNYQDYYPEPEHAEESNALLIELSKIEVTPLFEGDAFERSDFLDLFEEIKDSPGSYRLKIGTSAQKLLQIDINQSHRKRFLETELHGKDYHDKIAYLKTHRFELEYNWKQYAAAKKILEHLDQYSLVGGTAFDYPNESPIILSGIRRYAKELSRHAYLLAADGSPNAALNELHKLLSIAMKAMPDSRSLIESLTWNAVTAICIQCAEEIIEHHNTTSEALETGLRSSTLRISTSERWERSRIAEMLYVQIDTQTATFPNRWGYPLFLPNATANKLHEYLQRSIKLSRSDDIEGLNKLTKNIEKHSTGFHFRNPFGEAFIAVSFSSIDDFRENFQKTEQTIIDYRKRITLKLQK